MYKQFAVTVATAVTISGLLALTLTPAMCALLLRPGQHESRLFRPFNLSFEWLTLQYTKGVSWAIRHLWLSLAAFALVIAAAAALLKIIPGSLVPIEDVGYFYGAVVLPDGASLGRTGKVGAAIGQTMVQHPSVEHVFVVNGFDLIGGGNKTSAATMFVTLKPWEKRPETAIDLIKYMSTQGAAYREGLVFAFNAPPIRGLGTAGGFEVYVQSRTDGDPKKLDQVLQGFVGELRKHSDLTGINTFFRPNVPQLFVEVDREKALALGVPVTDVFDALQSTMGSLYVNDFNKFGRTYRVQIQADASYRSRPEDLGTVYVRSAAGDMIAVKALISSKGVVGPDQLDRFNGFIAAKVVGSSVPGISSGQAIQTVEEVAAMVLPQGYYLAWTGQAFQEKRTGQASIIAFIFAVVMVFLILAAQYERWSLPLAVLLAVPFAVLGALLAVLALGMSNDIYFQIGLVTLIGLAAKNAILIVEFAEQNVDAGMDVVEAAVQAARQRFRPIIMTSLAFIFGVLPLVLATGAGAAARRSMGTGVFGGMLVATFIATLFIPLFFTLLGRRKARRDVATPVKDVA